MTATNHALTGAVIASIITVPIIALPLAFASHFMLDSLPHYGQELTDRKQFMVAVWCIDAVFLAILLSVLILSKNWLALAGALCAISPDIAWVYRYVIIEKFGKNKPGAMNTFNRFHARIQKFETKKGIGIEILWMIVFVTILKSIL